MTKSNRMGVFIDLVHHSGSVSGRVNIVGIEKLKGKYESVRIRQESDRVC